MNWRNPWVLLGGFIAILVIVGLINNAIKGDDKPDEWESESTPLSPQTYTKEIDEQRKESVEARAPVASSPSRRVPNPSGDRSRGFHCLSPLDGNHDQFEDLIRPNLQDPGSMKTIETGITPATGGVHDIRLRFTATNAYGARVTHVAYGTVDQDTCRARLDFID